MQTFTSAAALLTYLFRSLPTSQPVIPRLNASVINKTIVKYFKLANDDVLAYFLPSDSFAHFASLSLCSITEREGSVVAKPYFCLYNTETSFLNPDGSQDPLSQDEIDYYACAYSQSTIQTTIDHGLSLDESMTKAQNYTTGDDTIAMLCQEEHTSPRASPFRISRYHFPNKGAEVLFNQRLSNNKQTAPGTTRILLQRGTTSGEFGATCSSITVEPNKPLEVKLAELLLQQSYLPQEERPVPIKEGGGDDDGGSVFIALSLPRPPSNREDDWYELLNTGFQSNSDVVDAINACLDVPHNILRDLYKDDADESIINTFMLDLRACIKVIDSPIYQIPSPMITCVGLEPLPVSSMDKLLLSSGDGQSFFAGTPNGASTEFWRALVLINWEQISQLISKHSNMFSTLGNVLQRLIIPLANTQQPFYKRLDSWKDKSLVAVSDQLGLSPFKVYPDSKWHEEIKRLQKEISEIKEELAKE